MIIKHLHLEELSKAFLVKFEAAEDILVLSKAQASVLNSPFRFYSIWFECSVDLLNLGFIYGCTRIRAICKFLIKPEMARCFLILSKPLHVAVFQNSHNEYH